MFFKDIIGQEGIKEFLRRSVTEQRVSHAQLFVENEGYGALALAIAYAAYINCPNRTEEDACGVCPSCVKFKKFAHPDLHFIYPTIKTDSRRISKDYLPEWRAMLEETGGYCSQVDWIDKLDSNNKQITIYVDDADYIIKMLNYKSYESEYKIVIVWLIEKLNYQAAPKLLKILEEPPEKTLFILATQSPEEILNTIKSRTQLLRIPPIDQKSMIAAIERVAENSNAATVQRIAHLAEGSWTKAQNLITIDEDEKNYFNLFLEWMRICYTADIQKAFAISERFAKMGRENQKNFFSYTLQLLHFFIQYHIHGTQSVKVAEDEMAFIKNFSIYIRPHNVSVFAEEFEKAIAHLERNANPTILFMDIGMKVMMWIRKEKPSKTTK